MKPTTVGSRLRLARTDADLTQSELARRVGCTQGLISSYETDEKNPPVAVLVRLCTALGADVGWVATGKRQKVMHG